MNPEIWRGELIPLLGTTLGAACVFVLKSGLNGAVQRALSAFAAGVMTAASVWSLLLPAMEQAAEQGEPPVVPAVGGFWLGVLFLLLLDRWVPHLHLGSEEPEGPESPLSKTAKLLLAVTIHNIPEGMAVGVVYAGYLSGGITAMGALSLALGIAIQNVPEGAIISMPLRAAGNSRWRSFAIGSLSGIVEPIGGALVLLLASAITGIMPYLLAFAAGAMLYVVVEELIPETAEGAHSNLGTVGFALGFALMMALDVLLG